MDLKTLPPPRLTFPKSKEKEKIQKKISPLSHLNPSPQMNNTPLKHSRNMVNPGLHMLEDERGSLFPAPALAKINPAGKFPPHEKMAQSAKRRNKKTEEDKGSWRGMKLSTAAHQRPLLAQKSIPHSSPNTQENVENPNQNPIFLPLLQLAVPQDD